MRRITRNPDDEVPSWFYPIIVILFFVCVAVFMAALRLRSLGRI